TGAAYAAMRLGRVREARALFGRAIALDSTSYDAVSGAGMAAFRDNDPREARRQFEHALRIAPRDSTALSYLSRLPGTLSDAQLPARSRPQKTEIIARAGRHVFEVRDAAGQWTPLWIKAVNLGAALPGKFPSEFPPDDGTYDRWIALIAGMGANAIRVYTIHPPHFYAALEKWNTAHSARPVWLIHGVWTELPPGKKEEKYDDPAWVKQFHDEIQRVVSLVHGDVVIQPAPGHASGLYGADVSRWTLGYIIGREWEPFSAVAYNATKGARNSYAGAYLGISGGNGLETWLTEQEDFLVTYEMTRYNSQRPIAYTNWPTLDPLPHPTETSKAQEVALLKARGEKIVEMSKEYDNDAVALDAVKERPTAAFVAGTFASFHAYPYYPDFLNFDAGYGRARSAEGPSNYFGYLRELVSHYGDMPVVISEYGVPSSRGLAHFQPQGWNHGGLSETQQAEIDARLTRDIYAAGAAGAGLFALIDEWFKKNWLVIDFERPADRKRLWMNALDAEEHYGVIAMRPGRAERHITIDGSASDWLPNSTVYQGSTLTRPQPALQLNSLSAAHDEGYLYLRLDVGRIDWNEAHYQIGIDTHSPKLGDTRLPNTGSTSPVGLEFVLELAGPKASRVWVDHPYNPYKAVAIPGSNPVAWQYVYNHPLRSLANSDGLWDSLVVVPNRRRITRDGTIHPAQSYDRNRLLFAREKENSLADWFADPATGVIEVRLPWGMLQVTDPSTRTVLAGNPITDRVNTTETDGFRFVVESYDPRSPKNGADKLPRGPSLGGFGAPRTWTWPKWEQPRWYAETKPAYQAMKKAFAGIPDSPARR
ncbi:MAG TPA: hypothetical protein VM166_09780, partial [Gemmatimonadaceae bacterium]|nr:hypothetical protein [Gemmatimonadaceae bacterium]